MRLLQVFTILKKETVRKVIPLINLLSYSGYYIGFKYCVITQETVISTLYKCDIDKIILT